MADVGLIGLGLVGSALAERFLAGGLSVIGYDSRLEAREAMRMKDVGIADSAKGAAAGSVVVLSLPDSEVVASVIHEIESNIVGKTIIDTTTGDPERTTALGQRLAGQGVHYVDATILGSSKQVREGNVVVMAGGEVEAVLRCEGLFRLFASSWVHVGPCGAGARMKLVVNLVLGLNRAVLAEGLAFARASGLDGKAALNVLRAGSAYSRVMDTKGDKMLAGDFAPEARLSQHHKDVRLILDAARKSGIELPLSRVHEGLLSAAEHLGCGDLDNSAVIHAYGTGG